MNRFFAVAILLGSWLARIGQARAALALGADEYVQSASRVELVRAQDAKEMADFSAPPGKRRVLVEEVLKGVDTTQEFLVPEGALKADEKAVVLFAGGSSSTSIAGKKSDPRMWIWRLDGATELVNTGDIPAVSGDDKGRARNHQETIIPLRQIRDAITAGSPEEVGLNAQVIDALLSPEKNRRLAAQDASRATYVRFVLALHDLGRDIPALSRLLESRDKATRDAASAQLIALAGPQVKAPADESIRALHHWSADWSSIQLPLKPPAWPPVPEDTQLPGNPFPAPLLQAVRDSDADAFAKAFPEWLDSGAMRDRLIQNANNTLRGETEGNPVFEPDGKLHLRPPGWPGSNLVDSFFAQGGLIPAPRLPMNLAVDPDVPAQQRLKYLAMLAARLHREFIARDQAARLAFIQNEKPDSEAVRRAAVWEVGPQYTVTAGRVALEKLASLPGQKTPQLLLTIYVASGDERTAPSDEALHAARAAIEARNQDFIRLLLEYVRTHEDSAAMWGGRLLCQEGQADAIPIMQRWLRAKDPEVRRSAAFNLCFIPGRDTVPALLEAIRVEPKPQPSQPVRASDPIAPREQMLIALAQTGDPRGLDTLIAAAQEPCGEYVQSEIVRGLARFRDPKGIPALAHLAGKTALHREIVNAFYCIVHDSRASGPFAFNTGGDYQQDVREGLERIKKWKMENGK